MRDRQQVGAADTPASAVACTSKSTTRLADPDDEIEIEIDIEIDEEDTVQTEREC